jgi:hypothetical protein
MISTSTQSSSSIVMIRPHHFTINIETAVDNAFQTKITPQKKSEIWPIKKYQNQQKFFLVME